jgi:hypothetical protein
VTKDSIGLYKARRRNVAALRILNGWLLYNIATRCWELFGYSSQLVFLWRQNRTGSDDWMVATAMLFGFSLVLLSLFWYAGRIYLFRSTNRPAPDSVTSVIKSAVKEVRDKLSYSSRSDLEVCISYGRKAPPVAIRQRRRKILISIRNDFAALGLLRPRVACAVIAHELTHVFQWDTLFGHAVFRVSITAFVVSGSLGGLVALYLGYLSVKSLLANDLETYSYDLHLVFAVLIGMTMGFLNALWSFAIRRWSEYVSDQSAVLSGYGEELTLLLKADKQRRSLRERLGFSMYPSSFSRLRRIKKHLTALAASNGEDGSLSHAELSALTRLRLSDYLASIFLRVGPLTVPLMLADLILILLAISVGGLPQIFN